MSARERDYHFLRAELAELDRLLSMTPESAVIDRMSLKYRRSQVQAELEPVRRRLSGRPVPISPSRAGRW